MTRQELNKQWESIITAYKESGLTQTAFCKAQGINLRQLNYRLRKQAKDKISTEPSTTWLLAEVNNQEINPENTSLNIKIGPATIEVKSGFDEKLLLDVLKILREIC